MTIIAPIAASSLAHVAADRAAISQPTSAGFADLLINGLKATDAKVAKADALIEQFATGEAIPVHQVTMALEEARIAVDMATQVRSRLLETYRDFMSMQL